MIQTISILCAVALGIECILWEFNRENSPTTDASRYSAILKDLGYPVPTKLNLQRIDSFPAQIPSDATNVTSYYSPGGLQAGSTMQLRCTLPQKKIDDAVKKFSLSAKEMFSGPFSNPIFDPGFRDATNPTGVADLPGDFQIYILDSHQSSTDTGEAIGVAISRQRGEIIYWLTD